MMKLKFNPMKKDARVIRERSGINLAFRSLIKKTSGTVAAVMIISMLLPVLAFAGAWFKDVTFNSNGTVSGQVYFANQVTDSVYLSVYSPSHGGTLANVSTATYSTYGNGFYYYNFSFDVSNATYNPIQLSATVNNLLYGVSDVVYKQSGGSTGGGIFFPPTTDTITVSNGQVDSGSLKSAFANNTEVTINVSGDSATLPASGLLDAAKKEGATVTIKSSNGTFELPLSVLDFDALSKELGVAAADLNIVVSISKLSGDAAKPVADAVAAAGGKALASAVDFSITIEGKDGKKVTIDSFDKYVKRTLPLTAKAAKTATVALFNPETGALSFVPGQLYDTEATFWRTGNSVYTVVELEKSFADVASHWAKADIELLASKLIIDGVTDTTFEADRNITRAEFAALVVRSLGLAPAADAGKFSDVKSGDWYAGVVAAAAAAGIVDGYEDGTFRPQAPITREELAAMVVRALNFAGVEVKVDAAKQAQLLSAWNDADKIVWGHKEVAVALEAGIVNGMTDTTLETNGQATRAQAATMLKRFLAKAEFIN